MSLKCGRKLWYPEETHEASNLHTHEPMTFLLWGDSEVKVLTTPPCYPQKWYQCYLSNLTWLAVIFVEFCMFFLCPLAFPSACLPPTVQSNACLTWLTKMHVPTLTAHNTELDKQLRIWKDEWISQDALIMIIHFLSFFFLHDIHLWWMRLFWYKLNKN